MISIGSTFRSNVIQRNFYKFRLSQALVFDKIECFYHRRLAITKDLHNSGIVVTQNSQNVLN